MDVTDVKTVTTITFETATTGVTGGEKKVEGKENNKSLDVLFLDDPTLMR